MDTKEIILVGSSFSLYPMSDNFVEVIETALSQVDTSKVWIETDDVSTTIRGKLVHVFDVTKFICLYAAKTGKHVAFQSTFATGCSSNEETDNYLAIDDTKGNKIVDKSVESYFAAAKFSLYPLGGKNNLEIIFDQIDSLKEYVDVSQSHYSTKLEGGLIDIFNGLENTFQNTIEAGYHHIAMTVNISMNSPSHQ